MGRILRWGSLQLCQSLVNGLYAANRHRGILRMTGEVPAGLK